jgi:osmotically-inducible protein OsmY
VVTERGSVFLMGLLTKKEAQAVTEVVRYISGVRRVVKVFEYI